MEPGARVHLLLQSIVRGCNGFAAPLGKKKILSCRNMCIRFCFFFPKVNVGFKGSLCNSKPCHRGVSFFFFFSTGRLKWQKLTRFIQPHTLCGCRNPPTVPLHSDSRETPPSVRILWRCRLLWLALQATACSNDQAEFFLTGWLNKSWSVDRLLLKTTVTIIHRLKFGQSVEWAEFQSMYGQLKSTMVFLTWQTMERSLWLGFVIQSACLEYGDFLTR